MKKLLSLMKKEEIAQLSGLIFLISWIAFYWIKQIHWLTDNMLKLNPQEFEDYLIHDPQGYKEWLAALPIALLITLMFAFCMTIWKIKHPTLKAEDISNAYFLRKKIFDQGRH